MTATGEILLFMRADPDVAGLPRRLAAVLCDGALGAFVLGGGGAALALRRATSELSPAQRRAIDALKWVFPPVAVLTRGRRTPGQRLMGIRRVDARTGGPPSLGAAAARQLYDLGLSLAGRRATRRTVHRYQDNQAQLRRRLQQIETAHAGDTARIERETAAVRSEIASSCLGPMVTGLARTSVMPLLALRSPRRQTLADLASGTVIIKEPRLKEPRLKERRR